MIDIKVPTIGESITEVTLLKWVKPAGSYVERDAVIAELESEKANARFKSVNELLNSGVTWEIN